MNTKNWRVQYRYNEDIAVSIPMDIRSACDYLEIFKDALCMRRTKWPYLVIKRRSWVHRTLMFLKVDEL